MTLIWFFTGSILGATFVFLYFKKKIDTVEEFTTRVIETKMAKAQTTLKTRLDELQSSEMRLKHETQTLKNAQKTIQDAQRKIDIREKELSSLIQEAQEKRLKQEKTLEQIASLSRQEAQNLLFQKEKEQTEKKVFKWREKHLQEVHEEVDRQAKDILLTAINRLQSSQVQEVSTTIVTLSHPDEKAKIIGRDGRNLRAFEQASGTTLLVDEAPLQAHISCFDPVRRHIAAIVLHSLLESGKINPETIQETFAAIEKDEKKQFLRLGQEAAQKSNVENLHPEILILLGKLKTRSSHTQNVLQHSIEVSHLCGLFAAELQLNEPLARRIGLLHDIGKVLPAEEGHSHAIVGARFAKEHGESEKVANGIACHHAECAPQSMEGALTSLADTISATRPGARKIDHTKQLERYEALEAAVKALRGVKSAFVFSQGRELRVYIDPEELDDREAEAVVAQCVDLLEKQSNLSFKIKISIIREKSIVIFS